MTVSTGRDSDKFMLRFPDGMRDRLKQAAAENNRSMNAEIIARLEASFSNSSGSKLTDRLSEQEKAELWDFIRDIAKNERKEK
ncbi:Arc family DNA-binding protein [Ochrobactrum intermedium]|uniref:Arc family DNA-binding protein n=1 Tax=Brucella intermedia TaxID=94625 RepID=UPI00159BFAF6|nr:Arc family DNA-binding protein [Brucella intermedia]NVM41942.1 Arc family DNA-binding protein [Brucella intermedia]